MKLKSFDQFLNEKKEATAVVKITKPSDETNVTIPKKLNDLIKSAKEKNDHVADLTLQLKAANKEKEMFDHAVIVKLDEMKATSVRVGKILAFLDSKKGRDTTSWKSVADELLKKIFALDQKAASAAVKMIEAMKKPGETTKVVKYDGPVGEGLSDAWTKFTAWVKGWKDKFFKSADEYTDAADDLEVYVNHHFEAGL